MTSMVSVQVEFTNAEAAALRKALASYRSDLRMEIADTDRAALRDALKVEEGLIVSALAKLEPASKT